jgi:predicted phosphodiesterase
MGCLSGHTHKPSLINQKGVLFLNPGSATLPKSACMDSAALLHIHRNSLNAEIVELEE